MSSMSRVDKIDNTNNTNSNKSSIYSSSLGIDFFDVFESLVVKTSEKSRKSSIDETLSVYLVEIMSYVVKALRKSESRVELLSDALEYLDRIKKLTITYGLVSKETLPDHSQEKKYCESANSIDIAKYLDVMSPEILFKDFCFNILKVIVRHLKLSDINDDRRYTGLSKLLQDLDYYLNRCFRNVSTNDDLL